MHGRFAEETTARALRAGLFAGLLAASFAPIVRGGVPVYTQYQLQARANFSGAFNLPNGAFFANNTPQISDAGRVAFHLSVLPPPNELKKGIWFGGNGSGSIVHMAADDAFVSGATLNNNERVAWEQTFSAQNGLWVYTHSTMTAVRQTTLPIGASNWSSPTLNDANQIGYRVTFSGTGQAWYSYTPTPAPSAALHAADNGVLPESPYSFVFTPAFNNNRQIAGKLRLGPPGQVGNSQPDQIRIFNADSTSVLIAEDRDSNPASPFSAFDNSVALTNDGRVAFIANLFAGGRGVYLSDGATTIEIAHTATSAATNIEFFAPAVNEQGWVAFRAFEGGFRAIWVGDGTTLRRVVREHDILPSDLGPARVDQNNASDPVFGGGVSINECGDVIFNAGLAPPDNDQIEWGSGVYVALAPRETKGDLNCSCTVTLDDVGPFVQALIDPVAYGAAHPDCPIANADFNGDTFADGQDIPHFIAALIP